MDIQDSELDLGLPVDYRLLPIRALRMTARKKLAGFLDLEGTLIVVNEGTRDEQDVVNDCNGLAELAGLTYQTIRGLQDPTVSNSEMRVDETKYSTDEDVIYQRKTYYDAFVCYTDEDKEDRDFVRMIIKELEERRGLKLFVPGRNDLPGSAQHTVTAYLIEERCKRVIIIMSKPFMKSQMCDFQVKFAFALSPGARSKKLIPVIREKGTTVPRILKFLAVCDFTKADILDWVWDRLYTAVIAPLGKQTFFEPEDPNNPYGEINLKEITFPSCKRLDDASNNNDAACGDSSNVIESTTLPIHEPRVLYNRGQPYISPVHLSHFLRSEDQMSCSDNQSYTQSVDSATMSSSDSQHEASENSESIKSKQSLFSSLLGRNKKSKKAKAKTQNEPVEQTSSSSYYSNSHVVSSTDRSAPVRINYRNNFRRRDPDEFSFLSSGSASEELQFSADQMEMDEI
ncbi:MYD88-like protein [Mya arenaria]|uniref:MYD88-like protein n=1 Tax=Mya arenaria TaxID=6604 RepID=A0ABY7E753_MYAAR|nr:MYD88-like protein [Mya arenaria]